jgi:hypothetical protein
MREGAMSERIFKYVRHADIDTFKAAGWIHNNELAGTHHGFYGELMEWKGEGEPVYPNLVACVEEGL